MNSDASNTEIFWENKKDTYIKLKLWNDELFLKFSRFSRTLEFISSHIFKKLSRGKDTSVALAKYLKDHATADMTYSLQLKNQLLYLPSSSNPSSDSLKSSLAVLSHTQSALSHAFRDLGQGIEQIINNNIAISLMNYERQMSESHTLWTATFEEQTSSFHIAEKHFKDYLTIFSSQEVQFSKKGYVTSCLWLSETKYLSSIDSTHKLLISTAILLSTFWEKMNNLEKNRIESVKTSVEGFLVLHKSVFNQNVEEASMILNDVAIDKADVESVFSDEELKVIGESFGEGKVLDAMINWKLAVAPRSNLVVKEAAIERETGVFKVWKSSYAIATVDKFLHVFNEDPSKEFQEPVNTVYLPGASIIENEELYFEIIEAKNFGIFSKFSAPRRSVFKLNTLQEFLAWVQAIKGLTS